MTGNIKCVYSQPSNLVDNLVKIKKTLSEKDSFVFAMRIAFTHIECELVAFRKPTLHCTFKATGRFTVTSMVLNVV